ncbi:MAG: aminotransferase class V-fold PLP-dependent enzyme [Acetobacteraceae bacterium]|nr:aminotransferase class V-fold PLP-dependent enzyme [Acetobacteraceae bacterium]
MAELGAAIRGEWTLDRDWLTVNHGSYGAAPKAVLAAQQDWRSQMEAGPTRFFSRVYPAAVRAAAGTLARFVGANSEDIAFVTNATEGCNAVLRSLALRPGDEVLVLTHGYGAVRNTVRYVTERAGARMQQAALPFPDPDDARVLAALEARLTPRTRLAVLDHITSASALVLPIAAMTALCRDAGVPVLVDGAHAPGQVTLDLAALGADWYAGNCHKWLCAPKGSGFLWAAPDRQADLHPVSLSHGLGGGFLAEFDWTGTRDPSAWLAVSAAIGFHERLGGADLRARNAALAAEATALLARRLKTGVGASGAFAAAMGVVRLPVSGPATTERAHAIRERLLDARTDAPVQALDGALWLRLSAAAYNERADYERLADIVATALHD